MEDKAPYIYDKYSKLSHALTVAMESAQRDREYEGRSVYKLLAIACTALIDIAQSLAYLATKEGDK